MSKVFVKAIHGTAGIGKVFINEGDIREMDMSDPIQSLVDRNIVRVFKTRKEAETYKYIPASEKAVASIKAFSPLADKKDKDEALITMSGAPTPAAVELEKQHNAEPDEDTTEDGNEDTEESPKTPKKSKKKQ